MNQDDIIKLKFPDCVRTRPGMYIGSTENPDVLLREIVDNSIDECYKYKNCNTIIINNTNKSGLVIDNGRGIPIKPAYDNPNLTMAYESAFELHAGSKFNKQQAEIGQNGVGSSCVTALSRYHVLAVRTNDSMISSSTEKVKALKHSCNTKDDLYYVLVSRRGIVESESLITKADISRLLSNQYDLSKIDIGTLVYFEPDPDIFNSLIMHIPESLRYFKCIADKIYKKKISVIVNGSEYTNSFTPFNYQFLSTISTDDESSKNKEVTFLVSCKFNDDFDESDTTGSVNGLICNQGYHINFIKSIYKNAYNTVFPGLDYRSRQDKGMDFSVICLCPEPVFASQTKERCANIPGIPIGSSSIIEKSFIKLINSNYNDFKLHNKKLVEFINLNRDLSRMELLKSKIPVLGLDGGRRVNSITPQNVKTCSSKDRSKCELFIVEGKSAAGSVIKARDTRFQAVLPLRGKPLNSAGLDIIDILQNQEMKDLIATIGTGVDERFSLNSVQYGKIIITSDADPDGANIASLVLGLFFSHMKYLINAGMVYICESPLYKQGNTYYYAGDESKLDKSKPIQRYKGLGELNPSDVKYSITDSNTRRLIRIVDIGLSMEEALRLITSTYARKVLMMNSGIINEDDLLNNEEVESWNK